MLKSKSKICIIIAVMNSITDIIDESTIPKFDEQTPWQRPECEVSGLMSVVPEFKDPFSTSPRVSSEAHHYIPSYIWKSSANSASANSSTLSGEYQRIDLTYAQ